MGAREDPDKITIFVIKEFKSKSITACVCPKKGNESTIAAETFIDFIAELGYRDAAITIKSDQEPALVDVAV